MAYTWTTVATAFNKTYDEDGVPLNNGYDYQPGHELLKRIVDTAGGRLYVNESGQVVYESRLHREA